MGINNLNWKSVVAKLRVKVNIILPLWHNYGSPAEHFDEDSAHNMEDEKEGGTVLPYRNNDKLAAMQLTN